MKDIIIYNLKNCGGFLDFMLVEFRALRDSLSEYFQSPTLSFSDFEKGPIL